MNPIGQGNNSQTPEQIQNHIQQFSHYQQNYNQIIAPPNNNEVKNNHLNLKKDQGQQEYLKKLKEKLLELRDEINKMPKDPEVFKNHQLPLARVKKIMKSDEDVRMISAEAPVLFAKACEIFIIELTFRAWQFTEEGKRRTLQKSDIAACIYSTETFDFLMDIIPKEEVKSQIPVKKNLPSEGYFGNLNNQFQREFLNLQQQQATLTNSSIPQVRQQQQGQFTKQNPWDP